jgi:hypothetical protein
MLLRDFLETKVLNPGEMAYMPIDPKVQFAHTLSEDGPMRMRSQSRVLVPMLSVDPNQENDLIAEVLDHAAGGFTHRAQNYAALNSQLWAKLTHSLHCLVMHPIHKGKFEVPQVSVAFYSEKVAENRILCLGGPNRVGTYLIQGDLCGVFVTLGKGVQAITLYELA